MRQARRFHALRCFTWSRCGGSCGSGGGGGDVDDGGVSGIIFILNGN